MSHHIPARIADGCCRPTLAAADIHRRRQIGPSLALWPNGPGKPSHDPRRFFLKSRPNNIAQIMPPPVTNAQPPHTERRRHSPDSHPPNVIPAAKRHLQQSRSIFAGVRPRPSSFGNKTASIDKQILEVSHRRVAQRHKISCDCATTSPNPASRCRFRRFIRPHQRFRLRSWRDVPMASPRPPHPPMSTPPSPTRR
jgi:hypothetical protein